MHSMEFAIRTTRDPTSLAGAVRSGLIGVDKNQPVEEVETLAKKISDQALGLRYVAALMAIFGVIALLLSATGVYGVMAYSVSEQRHEIGVRMALGARSGDVFRPVMRHGLALTLCGVVIGAASALGLARLVSTVIYGVSAWDAVTFTGVPLVLAVVALAACFVPARRATKVDPMAALRYE